MRPFSISTIYHKYHRNINHYNYYNNNYYKNNNNNYYYSL